MGPLAVQKNIQRFVLFQLTIDFVAIVIVLLGSIFGSQLPLTVTQMLWVNLIMDTFAALALASLPPSRSVMREKPRKNSDFVHHATDDTLRLWAWASYSSLRFWACSPWFGQGITPYELSVFFTVFVMLQFWNMFNAKGFGSRSTVCTHMKGCSAFYGVLLLILVGTDRDRHMGRRCVPHGSDYAARLGDHRRGNLARHVGRRAVALDQAPTTRLIPRGAVLSRPSDRRPHAGPIGGPALAREAGYARHSRKETATHRPTILSMFLIPEKRRKRAKKRDKIMKRIDKTTDRKVLLQIISVKIFR